MPKVFTVQLLFLHRYLFVLAGEAVRMSAARYLRAGDRPRLGLAVYASLLGQLLLRAFDRARRIHQAMLCRGFAGDIRMSRPLRIGRREILFTLGWTAFFLVLRLVNLPLLAGEFLTELVR